ncbi:MAG: DNA polymerase III subunit gamma/tau [Prevotellaceae bacterium]|jgi:DNA polymerase-3 subunit gamma/tau|nr:DNA polymerase III subunit gamma/tau [Prevotellaceae bacterium]
MENYIVSARKYRPATFDSVVGQHALTTTLKNAIATGKLAHAYLFCGPRGVGKTTCARIFAKTINCLNPTPEGEACNACESCVAFNEQRSYNIHELDAASNNSVDDIRQLVEQVRIPPQIGHYKVYIIDEVHMLSTAAFNAFLKTLEEPPHHAIFILATTEKHKIIPTILSRCQIYDFNRIGVEDTIAHLAYVASKEGITAEPEALNVIALKADGGMRDALSIFDQVVSFTGGHITYQSAIENLNVLDYEYYFRLTDYLLAGGVGDALLLLAEVMNKGFDAGGFITGLSSHFRDLLVSGDEATLPLLEVGAGIRQRYRVQAQRCLPAFLYRAMKLCNDCDLNYRASKNKRLLVELTLIELAQLTAGDEEAPCGGQRPTETIQPLRTPAAPVTPAPAAAVPPAPQGSVAPARQPLEIPPAPKATSTVHVSSLGISIKKAYLQGQETPSPTPARQAEAAPPENTPFTAEALSRCWMEYAVALPHEQIALSKQMQLLRPAMLDETTFEVVVDNELAAKEFTALIPALQTFLRAKLHHGGVAMNVRVSAPEEVTRAYSPAEKFTLMVEKNPSLKQLQEEFGLSLY